MSSLVYEGNIIGRSHIFSWRGQGTASKEEPRLCSKCRIMTKEKRSSKKQTKSSKMGLQLSEERRRPITSKKLKHDRSGKSYAC